MNMLKTWGQKQRGMGAWARRLAQGVIAREDVDESFFKAIPKEYTSMEIIYPVTLPASHTLLLLPSCFIPFLLHTQERKSRFTLVLVSRKTPRKTRLVVLTERVARRLTRSVGHEKRRLHNGNKRGFALDSL